MLRTAVENIIRSGDRAPRVRAFRRDALDYRLVNELVDTPLRDEESPTEWLARVSETTSSCLAINGFSAWSLELSEFFAKVIQRITTDVGHPPICGADVYTFIANCEWTPFGIHCDAEPSMIFHLGPSDKTLWVWPDGALPDSLFLRSPSFNGISFDFSDNLGSAEMITLRPGDFVSIPRGRYHLFRNDGPSAFVGLTIYPIDSHRTLRSAITKVAEESLLPLVSAASEMSEVASILGNADSRLIDRIIAVAEDEFAIEATCGFTGIPKKVAIESHGQIPDKVRGAFRGVVAAREPGILLARGRTIKTDPSIDFGAISEIVNSLEAVDVLSLPKAIEGTGHTGGMKVVELLYRIGGVVAA